MTIDTLTKTVDPDTITRLTTTDCGSLILFLVTKEKKEGVEKALVDAFAVADLLPSTEGAAVLAYKQLAKVRPCNFNLDCPHVVRGEAYAKELMEELTEMSDDLCYL